MNHKEQEAFKSVLLWLCFVCREKQTTAIVLLSRERRELFFRERDWAFTQVHKGWGWQFAPLWTFWFQNENGKRQFERTKTPNCFDRSSIRSFETFLVRCYCNRRFWAFYPSRDTDTL